MKQTRVGRSGVCGSRRDRAVAAACTTVARDLSRALGAAGLAVVTACGGPLRAPNVSPPPQEVATIREAPLGSRMATVASVSMSIEPRLGCGDGPRSSATRDSLLIEVTDARVRWTRARPAWAQYRVSVGGGMILSAPARVTLISDSVVTSLSTPGVEGPGLGPSWLFARAEAAARAPAGHVEIDFDGHYGLPVRILMDPDGCTTDDAVEINVTNFVASKPRP
jgi:hypothetical protein